MVAARPRPVPTRTCVVCRTSRPRSELARLVRTPDGRVVRDESGRLAGRGAYLCVDAACWRHPSIIRALERALRTTVPPGLIERVGSGRIDEVTEGGARGQE